MNELIEGVLAVGPGLPPHDGAGAVADPGPGPGHVLPVALHVSLLEVGGKPGVRVMFMQGWLYLDLTE